MSESLKTQSLENQEGPNWRAFGRILAIGRLRRLGLKPIPREVVDRLKREGKTNLLPPQYQVEERKAGI